MTENLMVVAQTFASSRNWSLTTLSKRIHGNQGFLENYATGRVTVTIRTYFQIIEKLRQMWPEDLAWPITSALPPLGKKSD